MSRRRAIAASLVLAVALLMLAGPAWAGTGAPNEDTGGRVATKLFRGIANAATGWMEIPKQISLVWQESGPGTGLSWGLAKGVGYAVARSVAGAYEIVTFLVPVPADYRPIMEPEYVLSDLSVSSSN